MSRLHLSNGAEFGADLLLGKDPEAEALVMRSVPRNLGEGRQGDRRPTGCGSPHSHAVEQCASNALALMIGTDVQELNVRPDHQGQGVGRALLDRVRVWATATGRSSISLTTFAEVPWNRPHYERLGFRVFAEEEIGPELRAVREVETAHGLDPAIRVCMRLDLDAGLMERP